jgi:hypothetical protein
MYQAFKGCKNLVVLARDAPNLKEVVNMSEMFRGAENVDPNVDHWNTESIEVMSYMFAGALKANPKIYHWDIRKVKNKTHMFEGATSPDIWSHVLHINSMENADAMFNNSGLTREYYDRLLIQLAQTSNRQNVKLGAENVNYCLGNAFRSVLIGRNWDISDGNLDCPFIGED